VHPLPRGLCRDRASHRARARQDDDKDQRPHDRSSHGRKPTSPRGRPRPVR
jgi:hypothetical protein